MDSGKSVINRAYPHLVSLRQCNLLDSEWKLFVWPADQFKDEDADDHEHEVEDKDKVIDNDKFTRTTMTKKRKKRRRKKIKECFGYQCCYPHTSRGIVVSHIRIFVLILGWAGVL